MTFSSRHPQFFYTTAPLPCPYLPDRVERKVVTDLTGPNAEALHDRLSRAGFRRSHMIAYAPVCSGCNACVPIRLPVERFQRTRTQRRTWNTNVDLEGFEVPPRATPEQFDLFQRYQATRHAEGDMASMTFADYRSMVEDTPIDTCMIEFRNPHGELLITSLVDRVGDGLSAVYSFYEPDLPNHSLGSFSIMWLVEHARTLGLPYVYLGYWIARSPKMAYKSGFHPAEILAGGVWRDLDARDLSPA